MQPKAAPPAQSLTPQQKYSGAGLVRQPGRQGHRVRIVTKKWCPSPHALGGDLVRKQANSMPRSQGADHLAHAGQVGWRRRQTGPVARVGHQPGQPGLPRRAVQHGQRAKSRGVALRQTLRRGFETAQMGGQEDHAAPCLVSPVDTGFVVPLAVGRHAQPQAWQFGHHAPGTAHRTTHGNEWVAGHADIGKEASPVGGRPEKGHPAKQPAHAMQQPKWHAGEKSENGGHRWAKIHASLSYGTTCRATHTTRRCPEPTIVPCESAKAFAKAQPPRQRDP